MTLYVPELPEDRKAAYTEKASAGAVALILVTVVIWVTPSALEPGPVIPGFMPAFAGAMFVIDLVLAVLLFSKASIGRSPALIRLGTAYLFAALIILPHVAAFPGAFVEKGLIGTSASAVWLWSFWHTGFALAIFRYALSSRSNAGAHSVFRAVTVTTMIVVCLSLVATLGLPYLPMILSDKSYHFNLYSGVIQLVVVSTNCIALLLVVLKRRFRSAEDLWLTIAMLAACVDVWLTFRAGSRFTLGWYMARVASVLTSIVVLISLFRDIIGLYSHVAAANKMLEQLAHIDGLTGLANRRQLDATLQTEWAHARSNGRPLSIILVDVDYFKRFNDSYGHQEGDKCLRAISQFLRRYASRPGDLAARYGGEEFALVLPSTDLNDALHLGNALRLAARALAMTHLSSPQGIVTISLGVASTVPRNGQDADVLIKAADAALYRAKNRGRDQVQSAMAFDFFDGLSSVTPLYKESA